MHAHTATPGWLGERLNVAYAIDVLAPDDSRRSLLAGGREDATSRADLVWIEWRLL